jgi:BirA family biotin operon repressor/biotin-[acetyl-CoA-carboxylase] ligase
MSSLQTLFIGRTHVELDTVESTSKYARELLTVSRPVEGTLISAHDQTLGRGQAGNVWHSQPGKNLTLSLVLYPDFLEADKQFFLNMAICLGVKDFCEFALNEEIKIKWPNDIYFEDKKLAGILIENTISGSKLNTTIVGIGININQTDFGGQVPNPASFALIGNKEYPLQEMREELCNFIEKYYLQLKQQHYNFLDRAYTDNLYRYQQTHEFKKGEQIFKGEINGVTKEGKLIIHSQGKELRFGFKEVEYII